MRLSIDHRTTYRFSEPQARVVQLLRMTPRNTHDQIVADWHIALDCDARITEGQDGLGNATTMLYIDGPVERIDLSVTGEVVTSHSDGVLHGTFEPLPARLFLRDTPMTRADAAITDFARDVLGDQTGSVAALHRLNRAVGERSTPARGRPEAGLTAADAFKREAATARDLAHVFIAAARACGVPARYVSGYCDRHDGDRPAPHGWADAWIDGLGWVGFDPMLRLSPEEHHVRVAVGFDSVGASPVAGTRMGEGDERLNVAVSVSRED
ncbi:transglutaminase family protein [Sphingomonas sp. Mn802worker]|uniref:transglutaminase family protein n=1 Tax=Sphingomonas sp. Mn802worker TaxID=629773 RepID=UPI00035E0A1B|nr:transglutaminase family protein [Sphingomonas sp. Mn802worker]